MKLVVAFLFYSLVSILIGYVNVSFRELRKEKEHETTAREKAEERKEFLNTLIRQDLGNKHQMINGYLQLFDDLDLEGEHQRYLNKALEAGKGANEILDLAKKLEEMEDAEWLGDKNIEDVMNHVLSDISDMAEREGVEIEENYSNEIGKVKGDYSLKILFLEILKTRIQTSGCSKIEISTEEEDNEVLLRVEDDGTQLPEDIKKLFTGELYTGETSAVGGARYYMLGEIAEHNNAKILVNDSELGGAEIEVYLQKS